jgi:hypothetical protein
MGQRNRDHEAPKEDHVGLFTHNDEHFVGEPPGQAGFGENQSDDNGGKDKHDGGVGKILESDLGRTDQEKGLKYADG